MSFCNEWEYLGKMRANLLLDGLVKLRGSCPSMGQFLLKWFSLSPIEFRDPNESIVRGAEVEERALAMDWDWGW